LAKKLKAIYNLCSKTGYMENKQLEEDRLIFVDQLESLLHQKKQQEALSLAEERLARFPLDLDARAFINLALIEMGRIEESRDILNRLEKDFAKLAYVYLRAADAYLKKGLNSDAVLCYQKFLSLNPLSEQSREITEKIVQLQKKEHLADEVDEPGEADMPKPGFYTITLADLYIKQGHWKMAAEILTEIIKRDPVNVQARAKLDSVRASLLLKSSPGGAVPSTNNLIRTLSCWLENIGRLKKHAT
jgi:tetratricopeptide (TPR) repeat protein